MSLTPNSALGASVPSSKEGSGGVASTHPSVRDAVSGAISAPSVQLVQGSRGDIVPHQQAAAAGAVPQPLTGDSSGEVALKASSSNPSIGASPGVESGATRSAVPASAPCGACKFLRRKCTTTCVFASHFQPDQSPRFANVHKIFGASNVAKWLQELPVQSRDDAVNSLCYEADARIKDPVYGCVGALFALQQQVVRLQAESAAAQAEVARLRAIAAGQVSGANLGFSSTTMNEHLATRLPPLPHQLPMVPSFLPGGMSAPGTMLMGTMNGFDHSAQASSMAAYTPHMKPGSGLGTSMLPSSQSATMPMFGTGLAQGFSSPPMGTQGVGPCPSSLNLSPPYLSSLHGVPSTGSTNERGLGTESPSAAQGPGRGKRLKSEQGTSSSILDMSPSACSRLQSFPETVLVQAPQRLPTLEQVLPHSMPHNDLSPALLQQDPHLAGQAMMFPDLMHMSSTHSLGLQQ